MEGLCLGMIGAITNESLPSSQNPDRSPKSVVASRVETLESHISKQRKPMLTEVPGRSQGTDDHLSNSTVSPNVDTKDNQTFRTSREETHTSKQPKPISTEVPGHSRWKDHHLSNHTVSPNIDKKNSQTLNTSPSDEGSVSLNGTSIDSTQFTESQVSSTPKPKDREESLRRRVIYFDIDIEPLKETVNSFVNFGQELRRPSAETCTLEGRGLPSEVRTPKMSEIPFVENSDPDLFRHEKPNVSEFHPLSSTQSVHSAATDDSLRRRVIFFGLDPDNVPDIHRINVFDWGTNESKQQMYRNPILLCGLPGSKAIDVSETEFPRTLAIDQNDNYNDTVSQSNRSTEESRNLDNSSVELSGSKTSFSDEDEDKSTLIYGSTKKSVLPGFLFCHSPEASREPIPSYSSNHGPLASSCIGDVDITENHAQVASTLHDIIDKMRLDKERWTDNAFTIEDMSTCHNEDDSIFYEESSLCSASERNSVSTVQPGFRLNGMIDAIRSTATPQSSDNTASSQPGFRLNGIIGAIRSAAAPKNSNSFDSEDSSTDNNESFFSEELSSVEASSKGGNKNALQEWIKSKAFDDYEHPSYLTPHNVFGYNGGNSIYTTDDPERKPSFAHDSDEGLEVMGYFSTAQLIMDHNIQKESKKKKAKSRYDDDFNPSDVESMSEVSSFNRLKVTELANRNEPIKEYISTESIIWVIPSEIVVESHCETKQLDDDTPALDSTLINDADCSGVGETSLFRKTMGKSLKLKGFSSQLSSQKAKICSLDRDVMADEAPALTQQFIETLSDDRKHSFPAANVDESTTSQLLLFRDSTCDDGKVTAPSLLLQDTAPIQRSIEPPDSDSKETAPNAHEVASPLLQCSNYSSDVSSLSFQVESDCENIPAKKEKIEQQTNGGSIHMLATSPITKMPCLSDENDRAFDQTTSPNSVKVKVQKLASKFSHNDGDAFSPSKFIKKTVPKVSKVSTLAELSSPSVLATQDFLKVEGVFPSDAETITELPPDAETITEVVVSPEVLISPEVGLLSEDKELLPPLTPEIEQVNIECIDDTDCLVPTATSQPIMMSQNGIEDTYGRMPTTSQPLTMSQNGNEIKVESNKKNVRALAAMFDKKQKEDPKIH